MKTLFLVRHAKADVAPVGLSDYDRPLSLRGQQDAQRMAALLARYDPPPQRIISSSAARALATAELLTVAFDAFHIERQTAPEMYLATTQTLLTQARNIDDKKDTVMLVGHNPGMTDFLNSLTDAGIDNLSTCAVARVSFDVAHWSEVAAGQGELLSLDTPDTLSHD